MRVVSDLHIDINASESWTFYDDFYIIAGDVSGDWEKSADFLNKNISAGIVIPGNHFGYNHPQTVAMSTEIIKQASINHEQRPLVPKILREDTREGQIKKLKEHLKPSITCLDNEIKVINNIAFVGCTLYSDLELFGKTASYNAYNLVPRRINDFRYVYTDQDGDIIKLNLLYCKEQFQKSLHLIERACKEYEKVVVVSHFAPSIKSILPIYKKDIISTYFASDLEEFIRKHKNINTWVHGHVHNKCDYYIDKTHILCYPIGYTDYEDNEIDFNKEIGVTL